MNALDILTLTGQTHSSPIDLKSICEMLAISVLAKDFAKELNLRNSISAYATNGDNVAIFYDNSIKNDSSLSRFEITKQLAHFLMFKKNQHIGNSGMHDGVYEFVSELLIPKEALRSVLNQLIMPSTDVLAKIFDVPDNLIKYRLSKLKIQENIVGYNTNSADSYFQNYGNLIRALFKLDIQ